MTRAEIEKLSGRELDVAVAEKVMGWTDSHKGYIWTDTNGQHWNVSDMIFRGMEIPFHPSTDPAACKLVRDDMSKRGYGYSIIRGAGSAFTDAWFWIRNDDSYEVTAETEEIACCRAALLALAEGGFGKRTST